MYYKGKRRRYESGH